MTRTENFLRALIIFALATTLIACGKESADNAGEKMVTANELIAANPIDLVDDAAELDAMSGLNDIPYPVYPNGTKYRVGGENGLKIVVFQTDDPFHKVDAYYNGRSVDSNMERIMAMSDYVRYSNNSDDLDPWATHLPGIVIHEFAREESRQAVGAGSSAKTNIIMSF